jgi:3-(3-hydroxy-phenyl)propionate hydroxylase
MSETEYDVAVIGCGPVGAIAANLFGHAGLRTVVIEREPEPYPLPRAVHIDHEMMRIFRSVGLADAILPLMREAHGHIHIGADGGVIRYLGSAGLPKRFGWANDYFFFQPELEAAMQAGLARYPHVELRRGVTVTALAQTSAGVALTTQCAAGERGVAARTVVACDGANSFVRKTLGIPLADMQFHEPWLVVDAEVHGPISFPAFAGVPQGADLQHLSVMLCDPKRPATLVPGRRNHRRWEFMLLPGEDDNAMMQSERVAALVAPYVQGTLHRIIRAATYRFHGLVAARWQDGRVFLAGDAAHQTPPFFGQGMCHGVRDVANLAWKLALIAQGKASPALLDTYQAEREPHVRAVIDAAIAAGRYICERDPQAARKRDETLRAAMGKPAPASASDLIPPIRAGIVSAADQPGRGARFIQPQVAFNGRRMLLDDATGGGFVLLASSRAVLAALTAGQWELWNHLGGKSFVIDRDAVDAGSIHDVDGDLGAWLAASGSVAVLLRPDFYVYGVAGSAAKVGAMIAELAAALRTAR